MSATSQTLTVEQRQAIDQAKEELVVGAEGLLDTLDASGAPRLSHSQLRNLIAIALETESPAVVSNFIRYQIGRAGRNDAWNKPEAPGGSTGDQLIAELESGTVAQALKTVERTLDPDGRTTLDEGTARRARIELIRHYLGFASRYLRYLEKARPQGKYAGSQGGA